MASKLHGTVQIHLRIDKTLKERIETYLRRTRQQAFGAFGAQCVRYLEDGCQRDERKLRRSKTK